MIRSADRFNLHLVIVIALVLTAFASSASAYLYRLAWDGDLSGGVVGFNVYRSSDGSDAVLLNSTPVASNVYLDEAIAQQTVYTYYVTSVNAYGAESEPSDPIEVYTGTYGDINGDDVAAADDMVLLAHYLSGNLDAQAPQIASRRSVDMDDSFALDAVDMSGLQNFVSIQ